MYGLLSEEHHIKEGTGAKFVAGHLLARARYGKAAIITQKPHSTISTVRKQWLKLIRHKQKERASTLDAVRIRQLVEVTAYMQSLRFTMKYPPEDHVGNVYIVDTDKARQWPPLCQTMYVFCDLKREELYLITAWMPKNALVVILKPENNG